MGVIADIEEQVLILVSQNFYDAKDYDANEWGLMSLNQTAAYMA
jgi:hypothetical protein